MRHLALIAMLLLAGSVSAAQCTTLYKGKTLSYWIQNLKIAETNALLDGGCDINSTSRVTPDGPLLTPLQATVVNPNTFGAGVRWLIKTKSPNLELEGPIGRTPLALAAEQSRLFKVMELVLGGALIDAKQSDSGKTALMFAKNLEVFKVLVNNGASVNATANNGLTPLHVAAQHFKEGYIADLLIAKGAKTKINAFAESSYSEIWDGKVSPLMLSATHSQYSMFLRRLIAHGANIEASDSNSQRTAIHYAARWGHVENVRRLINAGANVNAGGTGDMNPIFAAVKGAESIERTEVVKALIAAGSKVVDSSGNKPSITDEHEDATVLKAIIDNPKPYWPIRAYAMGIPFNPPAPDMLATTSWLHIGCHETSESCLVHFDCTDTGGAKTGNATLSAGATVSYSDSASSPNTTTIAGRLGLESDERWNGMLDCALRSRQKISAQIWSRTGTTLANNVDYIHSDKNHEAILQKVHPQASSQRMAVRIRCIDETDCKNTAVKCRSAAGTTASNMSIDVGKIDRLKTKTLYNYARGDDASDFPTGIASCGVRSKGAFLVQMLVNSNGTLLNHTFIDLE